MFEPETVREYYGIVLDICNEGLCNPYAYIAYVIIPQMKERRGHRSYKSTEAICRKLFAVNTWKCGEAFELFEIIRLYPNWREGLHTFALVALEVADILYYTNQLNCHEVMSDPTPLLSSLGIGQVLVGQFCVIKYSTRFQFGGLPDYKGIELAVMKQWLFKLDVILLV